MTTTTMAAMTTMATKSTTIAIAVTVGLGLGLWLLLLLLLLLLRHCLILPGVTGYHNSNMI